MSVALRLLGDVRWQGQPVAGERSQALLAALALAGGRSVCAEELVELVWGEPPDSGAIKRLQVLISRTRAALGGGAILRDGAGYRLSIEPDEVDVLRLRSLVRDARTELARDPARAAALAEQAVALGPVGLAPAGDGPLSDLRCGANQDLDAAQVIRARASGRTGDPGADALGALEAAHAAEPSDEGLLADLLRTEARTRGPAAALERFERHRRRLRDELGAAPGGELQGVQRELLALDRPVRTGVREDTTPLLGRDDDLARLRGLLGAARVVSIVGPGGLGKTRMAHAVARAVAVPAVHLVELVGVAASEDVVGEIGSALGVRDSVATRRALTPEQRADLRARIAQRLGRAPSLLVLDNCEHVVAAVAELVAFLVSTTPDLRVLTTSRAPLAIAAERVYLLGQLDAADGIRLFGERAVAARPGVRLDPDVVARIVERLDGLPLAIELAAARVRAMDVPEIDRRLADRFALLRGTDRSAPDRHRTLEAVIGWSWNLLGAGEQRALCWLAVMNGGFTLATADELLGEDSLDVVQGLVAQSLLAAEETAEGLRFRMLETVREFGRRELAQAGEEARARATRRRWAIAYAERHGADMVGVGQFEAIDRLAAEEIDLADELRAAIADGDPATTVRLMAILGGFWAFRGEHGRIGILIDALASALEDWTPPPELGTAARAAVSIALVHAIVAGHPRTAPLRAFLAGLGPGRDSDPRVAALVRVVLVTSPEDPADFMRKLERLAVEPDRHTALTAWQWLSFTRENAGDPAGSLEAAERALALIDPSDGPWSEAILHAQVAQLLMQRGNREVAAHHVRAALPVLRRLGAADDEIQLRSLLLLGALADGRLADAEAELEAMPATDDSQLFGGVAIRQMGRAELALAREDLASGLETYRQCAAGLQGLSFPGVEPTGVEPWLLIAESAALHAHARYAHSDADRAAGRELFSACRRRALDALGAANPLLDLPLAGLVCLALGHWVLRRGGADPPAGVALIAAADALAYNRMIPSMSWGHSVELAETAAPGALAAARERLGGLGPQERLAAARRAVEALA